MKPAHENVELEGEDLKSLHIIKAGEGVKKRDSYTVGGTVSCYNH